MKGGNVNKIRTSIINSNTDPSNPNTPKYYKQDKEDDISSRQNKPPFNKPNNSPQNNQNSNPKYPTYQSQDKILDKKFKEIVQPLIIPNVINNYTIGTANPLQDPQQMNTIYENMLPKTLSISRMNNLTDRNIIATHVKSNILNNYDEEVIMFKKGPNCIFNKLKTTTFNPYTYITDGQNNNPFKTIPENFLLYQSCYPILYDSIEGSKCKSNGTGLNMRIYRLNKGETFKNKQPHIKFNSNVFREMITYQQIKDNILDKKICPNFVLLYGYVICKESGLNFDSFNVKKHLDITDERYKRYLLSNADVIEELKRYKKTHNIHSSTIIKDILTIINNNEQYKEDFDKALDNPSDGRAKEMIQMIFRGLPYFEDIMKENDVPLEEVESYYGDDLLMALTESPTYSILKWIEKVYENTFKSKIMKFDGMHTLKEWQSVLIQILCAYHCLVKEKIYIPNFTLRDNVYIKELNTDQAVTKYWIYNINGVKHYVPNMGYLVLIDSSFKNKSYYNKDINKPSYKVISTLKGDLIYVKDNYSTKLDPIVMSEQINSILDSTNNKQKNQEKQKEQDKDKDKQDNPDEIKKDDFTIKDIINVLIQSLNSSNISENTNINKLNGVSKQESNVMDLLDRINKYLNDNKNNENVFIDCINDTILSFLHNRIGTELGDDEFKNIAYQNQDKKYVFDGKQINPDNVKTGDMVIYHKDIENSSYSIAQILYISKKENQIKVATDFNNPKNANFNDFFYLPLTLKQFGTPEGDSRETADCIEEYTINYI